MFPIHINQQTLTAFLLGIVCILFILFVLSLIDWLKKD